MTLAWPLLGRFFSHYSVDFALAMGRVWEKEKEKGRRGWVNGWDKA
jgi:hypothetical protein